MLSPNFSQRLGLFVFKVFFNFKQGLDKVSKSELYFNTSIFDTNYTALIMKSTCI